MSQRIHILAGPTAVGKTALALRWAREHNAEILNADALLFYKGMAIGTAKPTPAEQAQVPHHLVDVAAVAEPMSIKRYAHMAAEAVREITTVRQRPVLVTGGSGFYLKSFFEPVADTVEPDPEIRAHVNALEQQGLPALLAALHKASPSGTGGVHLQNPRRVARALERCLITGRSLPELEADFASLPRPFAAFEKRLCLLLAPDPILHPRIAERTAAMLESGLLDEVRTLLAAGIANNPAAASAIGYRETIAYLTGEAQPPSRSTLPPARTEAELAAQINLNTRRLVAKQRKWFRTQVEPTCVLTRAVGTSEEAPIPTPIAPTRRWTRAVGTSEEALYAALCDCFAAPS